MWLPHFHASTKFCSCSSCSSVLFSTRLTDLLSYVTHGRFTAFEKVHKMDPNSSRHGIRQFKTYLLHRLEKVCITKLLAAKAED